MKNYNEGLVTLHAIRLEVDDLEQSIQFYKKLGCVIKTTKNSRYSISVYLSFSQQDTIYIHLFKDLKKESKLSDLEKLPTFELAANEDAQHFYDEVYSDLYEKGIKYSNVEDPENSLFMVARFNDANNLQWELMDPSEIEAV